MKINTVLLKNYRLFEDLVLKTSHKSVTALIGTNGSGKTSVLDSIASILSHFIGKLNLHDHSYNPQVWFYNKNITNGKTESSIEVESSLADGTILTQKLKSENHVSNFIHTVIQPNENYLKGLQTKLKSKEEFELPIIVYYRTNRAFGIDDKINTKEPIFSSRLLGYKNALKSKVSSFQDFADWFINEENIENEKKLQSDLQFESQSLKFLRVALLAFMNSINNENYSNLRGKRKSPSDEYYNNESKDYFILVDKGTDTVVIDQLSEGEKMLLLIVSDIVRRLYLLNPFKENLLDSHGVVLIDEVELHLHPNWQRNILPALTNVFPNIQFIVSTHSPQVIASLNSDQILLLSDKNVSRINTKTCGYDSNTILKTVFNSTYAPFDVIESLNNIDKAIEQEETFEKVNTMVNDLKNKCNNDPGTGINPIIQDLIIQLASYKYELEIDKD